MNTTWKDFWSKDVTGHISLADITTTRGPLLMMHFNRIFSNDPYHPDLKIAFQNAAELKKGVATFYKISSESINLFKMGEVWMAPVLCYSRGQCLETGLPLAWVVPKGYARFHER